MRLSSRLAWLTIFMVGSYLFSAAGCRQESASEHKGETNAAYKQITVEVSGMT